MDIAALHQGYSSNIYSPHYQVGVLLLSLTVSRKSWCDFVILCVDVRVCDVACAGNLITFCMFVCEHALQVRSHLDSDSRARQLCVLTCKQTLQAARCVNHYS